MVTCIDKPTIESAQELMKHPNIRVLLVTGGGGVVKAAMNSGKKAITAGPGNPPVVVDETADLEKAAHSIIEGGGFDNNILCIAEKQVFAVKGIANQLKEEFKKKGCVELNPWQTNEVLKHVLIENKGDLKESPVSRDYIGRDANVLLETIGIRPGHDVPMIIAEVPYEHTLVWTEQMMPIMPIVKVPDVDTAIDMAIETEHGFGHTAMMHSRNIEKLSKMARLINTTIFVKNGASLAGLGSGGEGFASYSIASPTGEGITRPRTFTRVRRCTLVDHFRIV
jgi:acyl-CoA reductase-like NAD-dependent aldehyde dehydrogenase